MIADYPEPPLPIAGQPNHVEGLAQLLLTFFSSRLIAAKTFMESSKDNLTERLHSHQSCAFWISLFNLPAIEGAPFETRVSDFMHVNAGWALRHPISFADSKNGSGNAGECSWLAQIALASPVTTSGICLIGNRYPTFVP
jgi:hypothetical protein